MDASLSSEATLSVKLMSVVWELDLPPSEKLVLLALADQANDEGRQCWPSLANIARRSGQNERTVRRALRSLEEKGHLEAIQRTGTSSQYHLHPGHIAPPDKNDTNPGHHAPQTIKNHQLRFGYRQTYAREGLAANSRLDACRTVERLHRNAEALPRAADAARCRPDDRQARTLASPRPRPRHGAGRFNREQLDRHF